MADHMLQMQREMDSLMGAFGMPSSLMTDPWDIFNRTAAPLVARRGVGGLGRMVPLDVSEDDKCYTATAEVPGFDKSEIKVSVSEDGVLAMTGAHEEGSWPALRSRRRGRLPPRQQTHPPLREDPLATFPSVLVPGATHLRSQFSCLKVWT
ncbi:hypothetical protein Vafri_7109 [Volvox africanus]|nr:hypothetical protein Vafri_7109 [Volvox africanus]